MAFSRWTTKDMLVPKYIDEQDAWLVELILESHHFFSKSDEEIDI